MCMPTGTVPEIAQGDVAKKLVQAMQLLRVDPGSGTSRYYYYYFLKAYSPVNQPLLLLLLPEGL